MVRKKKCLKTRVLNAIAYVVIAITLISIGCLDSDWPGFVVIALAGLGYLFFFSYVNNWWEE